MSPLLNFSISHTVTSKSTFTRIRVLTPPDFEEPTSLWTCSMFSESSMSCISIIPFASNLTFDQCVSPSIPSVRSFHSNVMSPDQLSNFLHQLRFIPSSRTPLSTQSTVNTEAWYNLRKSRVAYNFGHIRITQTHLDSSSSTRPEKWYAKKDVGYILSIFLAVES